MKSFFPCSEVCHFLLAGYISRICPESTQEVNRIMGLFLFVYTAESSQDLIRLEGQNVRNFSYPSRIRWSRPPNFTAFYLYIRIFRCPENIRNDGFSDIRCPSTKSVLIRYGTFLKNYASIETPHLIPH